MRYRSLSLDIWVDRFSQYDLNIDQVEIYLNYIINHQYLEEDNIYCEWHHVIPKFMDSEFQFYEEVIRLKISDHYYAHLLLVKSFNSIELTSKLVCPLSRMLHHRDDINPDYLDEGLKLFSQYRRGESHPMYGKSHPEETRILMTFPGESNPNYGKIWITNGESEMMVKRDEKIPEGYYRGVSESHRLNMSGVNNPNYGKPRSEETRRRISEANTGQKRSDETRKHMSENHADVSGENNPAYGTRMINNGIINKRIPKEDPTPEGWFDGMKKKVQ